MNLLSFLRTRPRVPQKLSHKFTSNIKPVAKRLACFGLLTTFFALKSAAQLSFRENVKDSVISLRTVLLPQNFYNQHKGFLCKKEDQLQKTIGLPLFIRLGSKSYVDYLERKPNSFKP
jgi:hypothetical protein